MKDPQQIDRPKRGRPAGRDVTEQIAATLAKLELLRHQAAADERKRAERLRQVVGAAIVAAVADDAQLRVAVSTSLLSRVKKPADREIVQTWLATVP